MCRVVLFAPAKIGEYRGGPAPIIELDDANVIASVICVTRLQMNYDLIGRRVKRTEKSGGGRDQATGR
jgi:hypothetical protein